MTAGSWRTRAALAGLLALGGLRWAEGAGPRLTRGQVNEGIACLRDASQTYSVYVPSSYDPDRKQPALLVFDPRGRGTLAAELFRPGAERLGWLVISSNDTRSDGSMEPNLKALAALWPEVNERYATDPKRIYAAGFSGGGVLTLLLGLQTGALAGVVNCGGRLPAELPLEKARFAHYGAAGRSDFNHLPMAEIDQLFERLPAPHRLDVFDGGHEWLPEELATRALGWLELVAMKEATRPRDEELLRALVSADLAAGARLEEAARWLDAGRLYEALLRTLDGLHPLDEIRARLARLAEDGRLEDARREQRRADELERAAQRRMAGMFDALRAAEGPLSLAAFKAPARVGELQKKAAGTGAEAEAARRVLEALFVQASFNVTRELLDRGERAKAALALQLAAELKPSAAHVHYNLACVLARLGDRKRALGALEQAVTQGFADLAQLSEDPDLAPLRGEARYRVLLERLRSAEAPTPPS
jgi:predicted esterase